MEVKRTKLKKIQLIMSNQISFQGDWFNINSPILKANLSWTRNNLNSWVLLDYVRVQLRINWQLTGKISLKLDSNSS